jgi:hypothetical protein
VADYCPKLTFDKTECRYKLARDWEANPPSVEETEHIYFNLGLATLVLKDFCRQFAEGRLILAPDLSEVEQADTDRFLQTVAELMQTVPSVSPGGAA